MILKLTNAQRSLLCYYKRSRRYLAQGLTSHGLPRVRVTITPEEDKRRRLERWHQRAGARVAAGLTTRGTRRKQRDRKSKYRAWQAFRATIVIPPTWDDVLFLDSPTAIRRAVA